MESGQFTDVLVATTSAAVPTAGTIVYAYPTGRTQASYDPTKGEIYARGLMASFAVGAGITIAFAASTITVTYSGTTPIPANTEVDLQVYLVDGGVAALVPLADPATATLPQVATLLNQVVAALQVNSPPLV